jgi:probable rRNA maturation factor
MIEVVIAQDKWRRHAALLRRAARVALTHRDKANASLAILLTDDARLKTLNRKFRGKDRATNVLSFPAIDRSYLGDIALAHGVTSREAKAAGRTIGRHAAHLVVHGVLHLLGFDHEKARDARLMERQEVEILAKLGISDPYRARA